MFIFDQKEMWESIQQYGKNKALIMHQLLSGGQNYEQKTALVKEIPNQAEV